MQILISGKHFTISEDLRDYVQKKLQKLEKYANYIQDVRIILSVEKYRQYAEVLISGKNLRINETSEDLNMKTAIDKVFSSVTKTLRRYKDKVTSHRIKDLKDFSQDDLEGDEL
ncbi:MAG: ribosome-associated translation inhibitor RaiA [Candidatus Omnitrophota bacterium]|nr:MAG: ribosome-associated translation inhibitor RaiA [Candidatus Omnitrophota bacterium]